MDRPNILFILTDQHCVDALGCMGNDAIRTPNLDRLAAVSAVFDAAYTASPICGPARAAMFTGLYPPRNGEVTNWVSLASGTVLLTDRLAHLGYRNALAGKLHLSPCIKTFGFHVKHGHESPYARYEPREPEQSAYMRWLGETAFRDDPEAPVRLADADEYRPAEDMRFWHGTAWTDAAHHEATWMGNEGVRFLEEHDGASPFFLNVSFFGPHHPYAVPEPWGSMYDPAEVPLPETFGAESDGPVFARSRAGTAERNRADWGEAGFRKIIAQYYGYVSLIDHNIGRLLDALEARGWTDETLIVFASDHGDHIGDFALTGKGDMYEKSCRIPLMLKPSRPGGAPRRVPQVASNIDLFGTLLDAAGDPDWAEDGRESRSLLPLVEGASETWENQTFSIIGAEPESCTTMIRRDGLKLMRISVPGGEPVYEMHDLSKGETRDVFADPAYAEAAADLRARLDAWTADQQAHYPREIRSFARKSP